MVTELRTADGLQAGPADESPWGESWEDAYSMVTEEASSHAPPPPKPNWDDTGVGMGPHFSRVRRGYDAREVDRYVRSLERRLVAAEEMAARPPVTEPPSSERHSAAVELGTVLLDARDAAERIRAEAEVSAAQLVADAEREARQVVEEGRRRADAEAKQRLQDLDADRRRAEDAAAQLRDATGRALSEISEWRSAALADLERVVAALEQWPGTVPDPVSLADVLGPPSDHEPFDDQ